MKIVYDMETSDPDDAVTLCFLCWHPCVELVGVTVTPGTKGQIGVVKELLRRCKKSVPVGSRKPDHAKDCVSSFHYKAMGEIPPAEPDGLGWEVLRDVFHMHPEAVLLTGGPLGNPAALISKTDTVIQRWVCQGGFAGDNVVPKEHRLSKFDGKITCPTFNLNGDVPGAELLLQTDQIKSKVFVSKNVCHGLMYDKTRHFFIKDFRNEPGWRTMRNFLCMYLKDHSFKMLHDPLAAAVAIDESFCTFANVELFREKREWGCRPKEDSNTKITIAASYELFYNLFVGFEYATPRCECCAVVDSPERLIKFEPSYTAYDWNHETGPDPNRPRALCPQCAEEHQDYWKGLWEEHLNTRW